MRSRIEIDTEIKALEEMKPRVRRTTYFGDDNHAAIEAQLEVLRGNVDEDEIQDKFDDGEWTEHERDNAQQAVDWMEEYTDEGSPSENWQELTI